MPHTDPYGRTTIQGKASDNRTRSAFEWVDRHFHHKTGKHIVVVQGSYNRGGVSASAGTHDGGGALDASVQGMTQDQIHRMVRWFRRAGFAAWYRPYLPGVWGPHVHAELLDHRTASAGAKQQWASYRRHRNGLAGDGYDPALRPAHPRVWSHRRGKPVIAK